MVISKRSTICQPIVKHKLKMLQYCNFICTYVNDDFDQYKEIKTVLVKLELFSIGRVLFFQESRSLLGDH